MLSVCVHGAVVCLSALCAVLWACCGVGAVSASCFVICFVCYSWGACLAVLCGLYAVSFLHNLLAVALCSSVFLRSLW